MRAPDAESAISVYAEMSITDMSGQKVDYLQLVDTYRDIPESDVNKQNRLNLIAM